MSVKGKTLGFVGSGAMGEALIKGIVEAGLVPSAAVYAFDVRADRMAELSQRYGIRWAKSNAEVVQSADVVILAVKPQIMVAVLRDVRPALGRRNLVISIAAGVSTAKLRESLGADARLIRVMPNTPALVLEGVTAIARGQGLEDGDLETAEELFRAVGKVVILDEELMDAVTGLSGSGPAYVAIVIESLADGGVKMGLDRATAMTLATQTVLGAARLLSQTGLHPGALKDMVSSPGGTTIAGIAALEEGGIRTTFIKAVERATQRSRELGEGAGVVFVFGNLLETAAALLHLVLNIYIWILIARAIISWVSPDPYNPIVRFLYRVTEPVLRPIRNLLPLQGIGLDLSPMILLLIIYVLDSFLVSTLRDLASSLR